MWPCMGYSRWLSGNLCYSSVIKKKCFTWYSRCVDCFFLICSIGAFSSLPVLLCHGNTEHFCKVIFPLLVMFIMCMCCWMKLKTYCTCNDVSLSYSAWACVNGGNGCTKLKSLHSRLDSSCMTFTQEEMNCDDDDNGYEQTTISSETQRSLSNALNASVPALIDLLKEAQCWSLFTEYMQTYQKCNVLRVLFSRTLALRAAQCVEKQHKFTQK